nr:unnamed protein product [Callosobruchus chinensis]
MRYYIGDGLLNSTINNLPFEMHIPGYNWCGPGTNTEKRLARNDPGVNGLDEACKEHDITYTTETDLSKRHKADEILARRAMVRYQSKDASWKEKIASLAVAGAMKTKVKLGMGMKAKDTNSDLTVKPILNGCVKKLQKVKETLDQLQESLQQALSVHVSINKQTTDTHLPTSKKVQKGNKSPWYKKKNVKAHLPDKKRVIQKSIKIPRDRKIKKNNVKEIKTENIQERCDDEKNMIDESEMDIADDYPINRIQRKRKMDHSHDVRFKKTRVEKERRTEKTNLSRNRKRKSDNISSNTNIEILDESKPISIKAKRKLLHIKESDFENKKKKKLDVNEPIILPVRYGRKRKISSNDNENVKADDSNIPEKVIKL